MSEENKTIVPENPSAPETAPAAAKPSKVKKLLKILAGVLIALIVILLLVFWQLDRIATTSTRAIGTMITGTKVDVENIAIKPLQGMLKVSSFTLANPEGFHNPEAIRVDNLHVDLGMKSLLSDKVEVEYLEVSGVAIDFEYQLSGSNLDVILKNVEKNTASGKKAQSQPEEKPADTAAEDEKSAPPKKVVIRKLLLKDIKVTVSSATLGTKLVVPMLPIEMENVGDGKNLAETISEVLTRIITEIVKIVDFNALGKGLSDAGKGIVQGLDGAGKGLVKGLDGAASSVVSAGDSVGTAVQDTLNKSVNIIKSLPGLGD